MHEYYDDDNVEKYLSVSLKSHLKYINGFGIVVPSKVNSTR